MKKRNSNKNVVVALLFVTAVLSYSLIVNAGSLEPSAPPGSTMKTLDEVEPRIAINIVNTPGDSSYHYIISSSGSYYLTGDVVTNISAIGVNADNVTIDLMGYSLAGAGPGITYGVYMYERNNVEIRNGTIRDFHTGICDPNILSHDHQVIDVRCVSNTQDGIRLSGTGNLVKDCTVSDNGHSATTSTRGIEVGYNSTVTGNIIRNNGVSVTGSFGIYGINASFGCTVTDNVVSGNGTSAAVIVDGIKVNSGSTITGNTVYRNGDSATSGLVRGLFVFGEGCTVIVIGNTVYENGDSAASAIVFGICLVEDCFVAQNTAYNNGVGAASATNMNRPASCSFGLNHAP
jgi:hypothetical protein